jgi:hypothetical protein
MIQKHVIYGKGLFRQNAFNTFANRIVPTTTTTSIVRPKFLAVSSSGRTILYRCADIMFQKNFEGEMTEHLFELSKLDLNIAGDCF